MSKKTLKGTTHEKNRKVLTVFDGMIADIIGN